MIIKPRVKGFICLTAHPQGCAAHVQEQIDYVTAQPPMAVNPKNVLVLGASTGYGLASRITAAFGNKAATLGVFLEKPPSDRRTATAGWYNSVALEKAARREGIYARSLNGDAFSDEIKEQALDLIRREMGPIDLVVYSVAAPRRIHPKTGEVFRSTLKPIGQTYHGRTLDTDKEIVKEITLEPATEEDIAGTVAVMGGEDWEMWLDALQGAKLLAEGCKTVAYTYIGTELTWPIYWKGTIGKAKEDLDRTASRLNEKLAGLNGRAYVSVMKALVTQASSAIPVVPLYISLLYKIMKEKGGHEGAIQQIHRLFATRLYSGEPPDTDEAGRLRMDDWEMRPEIQQTINELWPKVTTENLHSVTDFDGYKKEFLKLFGFGFPEIDYDADVDPFVNFPE